MSLKPHPPPKLLPIVEHAKKVYTLWLPIRRNMARDERFGIGKRIDDILLLTLEHLREATYTSGTTKVILLGKVLQHTDLVRFFLQLAWEGKVLEQKHYILLAIEAEALGKMVGGWRKGLLAKTPPNTGGERKE